MDDEKAVEVMARGAYEHFHAHVPIPANWEKEHESEREAWRDEQRAALAAIRAAGGEVVWWRPEAEAEPSDKDCVVMFENGGFDIAFKKAPDHWDDGDFHDHMNGVSHFAILRGPEVKP